MPFKIRLCRTSLTKIYALPRKVYPYLTHFIPLLNIRWLLIKRGIDGSSFQYEMKNNEITDFKFNENNNWCTNLLKLLLLCVCVCVCVCFTSFIIPLESEKDAGLKLWIHSDQAGFTYWMSFLSPNLMEEISPNPEALSTNTLSLFS